jgi:CheY-like chemotaxis protein
MFETERFRAAPLFEMTERQILIVDDEPSIRRMLCCAIAGPDVVIWEADCGETALRLAREKGPFSLVITDLLMPGMDGVELARRLRDDGQANCFLFISGYCESEMMAERMRAFPTAAFLAKPFDLRMLSRKVWQLLDGGCKEQTALHAYAQPQSA